MAKNKDLKSSEQGTLNFQRCLVFHWYFYIKKRDD